MKRLSLFLAFLVIANSAYGNASGTGTVSIVGGMFTHPSYPASVYFGITPAPVNRAACNSHSHYQFVFDSSTNEGKALYAALLAVQASGKQIHVYGTGNCILGQPMEGVVFWNFVP